MIFKGYFQPKLFYDSTIFFRGKMSCDMSKVRGMTLTIPMK